MEDGKQAAGAWSAVDYTVNFSDGTGFDMPHLEHGEEIARRIAACVNACAGIDTEHLEQAQADHAEESEGGYLADVETRLEHTERELAHRSAALFERQQRVLSVMDELKQAVEARLAAEAQLQAERASLFAENQRKQQLEQQCERLLGLLRKFDSIMDGCGNWPDTSTSQVNLGDLAAEVRATIAAVKGGAEC